MAFYYIKSLILLILFICLIIKYEKNIQLTMIERCGYYIFNLGVVLLAVLMIGKINIFKDDIVFTALCQEGEESDTTDIFIEYIDCDGTEVKITDVADGKWYYDNETYFWQSEARNSSLKDITETVTIRVPLGFNREIHFGSHSGGYVKIQQNGNENVIDTKNIRITGLECSNLLLVVLQLLIQSGIVLIIVAGSLTGTKYFMEHYQNNEIRMYYMASSSLIVWIVFYMWIYRDRFHFWFDEMCQISFVSRSFEQMCQIASHSISDPFLYNFISWGWYRLMPFGECYMYIITEAIALIAMFLLGRMVSKYWNAKIGIFVIILLAIYPKFYTQFAFENRPYALWFLASVILYWAYVIHLHDDRKRYVLFLISAMLFAVMAHYLSVIICAMMFLCDLYFVCKGKRKITLMLPYIIEICCALPLIIWFMIKFMFVSGQGLQIPSMWADAVGVDAWNVILLYLTDNHVILLGLLFIGILLVVQRWMRLKEDSLTLTLGIIGLGYVVIMICYSLFLSETGSIGYPRYFICLLPIILIFMAIAIDRLPALFKLNHDSSIIIVSTIILILGSQCWQIVSEDVDNSGESYQDAADWLYGQYKDIYKEDTLVVSGMSPLLTEGWNHYYMTRKNMRDVVNCVCADTINLDELYSLKYKKVYVYAGMNYEIRDFLHEYYEKGGGREKYGIIEYNRIDDI